MSRNKLLIILIAISTLMLIIGSVGKMKNSPLQHLIPLGLALQFATIIYAIIPLLKKKNQ